MFQMIGKIGRLFLRHVLMLSSCKFEWNVLCWCCKRSEKKYLRPQFLKCSNACEDWLSPPSSTEDSKGTQNPLVISRSDWAWEREFSCANHSSWMQTDPYYPCIAHANAMEPFTVRRLQHHIFSLKALNRARRMLREQRGLLRELLPVFVTYMSCKIEGRVY